MTTRGHVRLKTRAMHRRRILLPDQHGPGFWRRLVTVFIGAILLGPAVATSASADTMIVPSRPSSETLITGTVAKDGVPTPGADVFVVAWPNDAALEKLDAGEFVDTKLVAHAITDATGQFVVEVSPGNLDSHYFEIDGRADFELTIADREHQVTWNFTATHSHSIGDSRIWHNPRIEEKAQAALHRANMGPTHISVDIGQSAYIVESDNEPDKWLGEDHQLLGSSAGLQAARVERAERRTPEGITPSSCTTVATNNYQTGRQEEFVRAIGLLYAPVTVIQEHGTKHTLGVAIKYDGAVNWTASGTETKTFQASASTNYGGTSAIVHNSVNYRQFDIVCSIGLKVWVDTSWKPHGYHSLNTGRTLVSRPTSWSTAANCSTYSAGEYTKSQGSNAVFSTGVKLSVINLSAQASFNSSTKLRWNFSSSGGWLCGSSSFGWVQAPQAGAFVRG